MSKTISVRLSDDDLSMLDFLSERYYGPTPDYVKTTLSPVIRSCLELAYEVLINNPDVYLVGPGIPHILPVRFYPELDLDAFRHPVVPDFAQGSVEGVSRS